VVVGYISESKTSKSFQPAQHPPFVPPSPRPPQSFASNHERRFAFQDSYESHWSLAALT